MSDFDPERLDVALRELLAALPPFGGLNERGGPMLYPGRSERCCGALVGDTRTACSDEARPGEGLCARCAGIELAERRRRIQAKKLADAEAMQPKRGGRRRRDAFDGG